MPLEPTAFDQFWRPLLLAGRHTDPTRPDEVVVNELFLGSTGLGGRPSPWSTRSA